MLTPHPHSRPPRRFAGTLVLGLVAVTLLTTTPARAQDAPPPQLVPADAELIIGLDARTLYADDTFNALMDLVEASESYIAHTAQLEAWGFDPRADVHEVIFAVDRIGAADAEFVVVVTGELSVEEMRERMAAETDLTQRATENGIIWSDARGTSYALGSEVAVAGVGAMFEQAHAAVLAGASTATEGGGATIWMRLATTDTLRAGHPALESLLAVEASIEVDSTPAFHIYARMDSREAAEAGMGELRHMLNAAGEVPEVSALGIGPLIDRAVVAVRGTTVSFDSEIDAASWNEFSGMLSDLVAEELR